MDGSLNQLDLQSIVQSKSINQPPIDLTILNAFRDILGNSDVKLDNMFIASLVGDIIRGMIYIQGRDQTWPWPRTISAHLQNVQGGPSGCTLTLNDIKLKVMF